MPVIPADLPRRRPARLAAAFVLLFSAFLTPDPSAAPPETPDALSIVLIQLRVDERACSSQSSFEAHTTDAVVRALEEAERVAGMAAEAVDLVVFPEYTAALHRIAAAYGDAIVGSDTFAEAIARISSTDRQTDRSTIRQQAEAGGTTRTLPPTSHKARGATGVSSDHAPGDIGVSSDHARRDVGAWSDQAPGATGVSLESICSGRVAELLVTSSRDSSEVTDAFWGTLAARFGVAIAAGTTFAVDRRTGEVRNRLLVYDESGVRIYQQDKVYLTPFETDILGLSPGRLGSAGVLSLRFFDLAFTICRDTFFDAWEALFQDTDVWFDLKANGAEYTQAMARRFETAVPERIAEADVSVGVTLCLTGTLLDLFWEGRSSIVVGNERGGSETVWHAATATGEAGALLEVAVAPSTDLSTSDAEAPDRRAGGTGETVQAKQDTPRTEVSSHTPRAWAVVDGLRYAVFPLDI